jgi:predicted regulator of Ras-like GTPase activity (Roadblock/LC7/MglB family)
MIPTVDPEVQKTVEEHLARVPGVRGALVVAADGLPLCAYGLEDERVGHWAAMGATLMGVARRAVEHAEGGGVRTLVIDMHDGRITLAETGSDSVLVLIAAKDSELDPSGPELTSLTGQLIGILGASAPAAVVADSSS